MAYMMATIDVLEMAESFISGFEDDEMQEGIGDILAGLRAAIERERKRPPVNAALVEAARNAQALNETEGRANG